MQLLDLPSLLSVSAGLFLMKGNDRKMQHLHYCSCNCFTVVQYSPVNKWEEGLLLKGKLWGWAAGVCPPGITRYTQLTQLKREKKLKESHWSKGKHLLRQKLPSESWSKTRVCLLPSSQAHVQNGGWSLSTDTHIAHANTLRSSQCSSNAPQVKFLQGLIWEWDGKIILGAFHPKDWNPNSKLIKSQQSSLQHVPINSSSFPLRHGFS